MNHSGSEMGHFWVSIQVGPRDRPLAAPMRALVDTGSTFTWIPQDVLENLGVTPEKELPFELADGREVSYPVAWVQISIEKRGDQPTIVVFAPPGSDPILGVVTLEEFLLAADPVHHRLVPVRALAKKSGFEKKVVEITS